MTPLISKNPLAPLGRYRAGSRVGRPGWRHRAREGTVPNFSPATDTACTYRALLRYPQFCLLWLGESSGRLGYQLTNFLLPLAAAATLGAPGVQVGIISAAQFVPVILFALAAGALAQRVSLRRLLVASSALRAGALGFLGATQAVIGLRFDHLVLAAVIVGTATVFYDVGYQASVPSVIPVHSISPANGLLQATYSVTQLGGPAAAGFLMQKLGLPITVGTAFALFLGATVSFMASPSIRQNRIDAQPVARSIGRGLRYVWQCRPIRDLCLQAGAFNFYEQAFLTVFLVFAVRGLRMSEGVVGAIVGAGSAGAFIGALTAPRIRRVRVGILVSVALPMAAAAFLLVPILVGVFRGAPVPLIVAFALNGVALSFFNVFAVSLRQSIPPDELLGSTTASYRLVSFGTIPVGALLGGVAIDAFGGTASLWMISLLLIATCLVFVRSPLRNLSSIAEARAFSSTWTDTS